jgi:hypothetical protein
MLLTIWTPPLVARGARGRAEAVRAKAAARLKNLEKDMMIVVVVVVVVVGRSDNSLIYRE